MSNPTFSGGINSNQQRLMLDVTAGETSSVPYEVFESSQAQLREAAVALSKHKSSLASSLGEVNNLRAMVSALERNVDALKIQNEDLFTKFRESQSNEENLIHQVSQLTETTEMLSQQLQLHAKSSAQRYSALQDLKEQTETNLRIKLDRVTAQLLGGQTPNTRVIPWSHTFRKQEHPAHIVRLVVSSDAQRENRMLRLQMPSTTGLDNQDGSLDAFQDLEKLMVAADDPRQFVDDHHDDRNANINDNAVVQDNTNLLGNKNISSNQNISTSGEKDSASGYFQRRQLFGASSASGSGGGGGGGGNSSSIFNSPGGAGAFSEDANMWRTVCRRLHQVLTERRQFLRTQSDGPLEFLLRSRHEMACAILQMKEDAKKVNVVLNTMIERMEGRSVAAAAAAISNTSEKQTNTSSSNRALAATEPSHHVSKTVDSALNLRMFEGHLEVMQTVVGDLNHTVHRAIQTCFTDADKIVLGMNLNRNRQQKQKLSSSSALKSPTTTSLELNNNESNEYNASSSSNISPTQSSLRSSLSGSKFGLSRRSSVAHNTNTSSSNKARINSTENLISSASNNNSDIFASATFGQQAESVGQFSTSVNNNDSLSQVGSSKKFDIL